MFLFFSNYSPPPSPHTRGCDTDSASMPPPALPPAPPVSHSQPKKPPPIDTQFAFASSAAQSGATSVSDSRTPAYVGTTAAPSRPTTHRPSSVFSLLNEHPISPLHSSKRLLTPTQPDPEPTYHTSIPLSAPVLIPAPAPVPALVPDHHAHVHRPLHDQ